MESNYYSYARKLEEFKRHILPASSILIVAHDWPDPDCLASAYGIQRILASWGIHQSVITFGGFAGRAQNKAMIRYLNIETVPFPLIEIKDFEKIILVDCFPGRGNVSLPSTIPVHAVFDHHLDTALDTAPYFYDIRRDIGATSTMITQYLVASNLEIGSRLATALFYGIKTDTKDLGRDYLTEDLDCYQMLFRLMDYKLLSLIENPDRDTEFFRLIHHAASAAMLFGTVGYINLNTIPSPDFVAELADFFHRFEKIEWMICAGIFKKSIYFSIRTKTETTAGEAAEKIASTWGGSGGGHGKIGAGHIPIGQSNRAEMLDRFTATFKEVLRIQNTEGRKMLGKTTEEPK